MIIQNLIENLLKNSINRACGATSTSAGCIGCLTEIIVSVKRDHAISNSSGELIRIVNPKAYENVEIKVLGSAESG